MSCKFTTFMRVPTNCNFSYSLKNNIRYLVLERVEGGELFDYIIKHVRLSETEALSFFQQIVGGVEYCHRHLIWYE